MVKQANQKTVIKVKTSYVSTIISISLVLFVLGLLGVILVNANQISKHVKENIGLSLYLKDDMGRAQVDKFKEILINKEYTNRIEFVSKEDAAALLKADLGEDFVDFLGYNPLSSSVDLYVNSEFAEESSVKLIANELRILPAVKEVVYQKDLITLVNSNIRKIGLILFGFSLLLLIVVIALINNTIRFYYIFFC